MGRAPRICGVRSLLIQGRPLAGGRLPALCAPLVGRDTAALEAEAKAIAARKPDLVEWRVDFFSQIADASAVIDTASAIRAASDGLPLLFTRRSRREGGEAIAIGEEQVVALYRQVCAARAADLIDFESGNDGGHVAQVREAAGKAGIGLVLSYHNFSLTPPFEMLMARFVDAERLGADVAKVAVMPQSPEDVLVLLEATLRASRTLGIPVIGMAMGAVGAVSRLVGGVFGSALTFAVGEQASAPGQVPMDDVRAVLDVLHRAGGAG
jgi:3-dehydroquinate dehydratase-1